MKKTSINRVIAALAAVTMSAGYMVPAIAADKDEKATREYVVSEFVQSVGRNNLTIKTDQADTILSSFTDSGDIDEEYREDIARAKAYTLVAGYEDGTLKPKDNVRRIEAMVMLSRALPDLEETSELIEFTDVPEWAKADMDRLTKAGLVYGYGDGTLGADDNITVEQVTMLTDRSDAMLNTTPVGESFYGYVNNKNFRNHNPEGEAFIDSVHGAVISSKGQWSQFSDRAAQVSAQTTEALKKLVNGEIEFEKGSAEQRVYDMYDCIDKKDEDAEKDAATFNEYRDRLLGAATVEDFKKEVNEIYKETGINTLYKIEGRFALDDHIIYPCISLAAPTYLSKILFDNKNTEGEKIYEEMFKEYASSVGKFSDKDIKEALKLQKNIMKNADYTDFYRETKQWRTMSNNYTQEDLNAEMEEIINQHPLLVEKHNSDDDNISGDISAEIKYTPEEASNLYDTDFTALLTDAGFKVDRVLMEKGADEVFKDIKINKSNLNAFKLNAVLKLSEDLNYASKEKENDFLYSGTLLTFYAALGNGFDQFDKDEKQNNSYFGETDEEQKFASNSQALSAVMKNDIGIVFSNQNFALEDLEDIADIFQDISKAYSELFDANEWMDDETKENAKKKLDYMIAVIGYPDNYGFADITPRSEGGTYFKNLIGIKKEEMNQIIQQCEDPIFVRTMMWSSPDEINAYYVAALNIVNIFSGISGGAFYDKNASRAQNLGAIGAVVGHEVGHAFDAHGSKYNEIGEYKNWWSDEAKEYYDGLKQRFIDYYANFEVVNSVTQNSETTITENMADFAGLSAVMEILKDEDDDTKREALESYANMWARLGSFSVITDSSALSDVHSANNVRTDAVVASIPEFYELYDVQEGDKMYVAPEDRLELWR